MKIIKYTEARNNLRNVLDECNKTNEAICILSKNSQAVIMSQSKYDSIVEQASTKHINQH